MISIPTFFVAGLAIEKAISATSDFLAVLDSIVSLMLIGQEKSIDGKMQALRDLGYNLLGLGIGKKLEPLIEQLDDTERFMKTIVQVVPAVQQSLSNVLEVLVGWTS